MTAHVFVCLVSTPPILLMLLLTSAAVMAEGVNKLGRIAALVYRILRHRHRSRVIPRAIVVSHHPRSPR